MGWFSSTWSDTQREHDRQRVAEFRNREARRRAARKRARQEIVDHPVRSFFRWATR
jgi:hypothetical protein